MWFVAAIKSFLLNRPWPTQGSENNKKDEEIENFVDSRKETLGQRFDEFWECPICLDEFKPDDEII